VCGGGLCSSAIGSLCCSNEGEGDKEEELHNDEEDAEEVDAVVVQTVAGRTLPDAGYSCCGDELWWLESGTPSTARRGAVLSTRGGCEASVWRAEWAGRAG